ncbi:MAG: hypothetical protein AB1846_00820 [Chloroflexota bacterium]
MSRKLTLPTWTTPLLFGAVVFLAYGLLARQQGFYWDDLPFAWIGRYFGAEGYARYFATNRPLRTWFFALFNSLLGQNPFYWQLFALFWRWMTGLSLWGLLRLVWPKAERQIVWVVLLFLIYPGFGQQYIAINYSNFFFIQTVLFVSLALMVLALKHRRWFWPLTVVSLGLSALNLFTLEYFALLDLLRPILIWVVIAENQKFTIEHTENTEKNKKISVDSVISVVRIKTTARHTTPYYLLITIYLLWRVFIFKFQTYQPVLADEMQVSPWIASLGLLGTLLHDLYVTGIEAWVNAFKIPNLTAFGPRSTLVYAGAVIAGAVGVAVFSWVTGANHSSRKTAFAWILSGLAAMLLAGVPFWLTRLPIRLEFPNDRFTLPFALGVSLVLVGLLELLPPRRWLQPVIVALLVGLAVGVQFQNANLYRRDWTLVRSFFWQLTWRAPALEPDTLLLSFASPVAHSSDNSMTAPLNWTYAPGLGGWQMPYLYYFIDVRLGKSLPALAPGLPISEDYLTTYFEGSTSNAVVLDYAPPGCLRILHPGYDAGIPLLPPLTKDALPLSNLDRIIPGDGPAARPPDFLFGPEPERRWCYYFEKAELARQLGDWAEVARLGEKAFALGDYPNEATERVVFLEGYARTGNLAKARKLSDQTIAVTPLAGPMLCQTWARIEQSTDWGAEDLALIRETQAGLECGQP